MSLDIPILPPSPAQVEIDRIVTSLQTIHGARNGKWVYPPLTAELLRTDTGTLWSFGATNNSEISYALIGDTMRLSFNIGQGDYSVLGAAGCNYLMLRIPDNYRARQRNQGAQIPRTVPFFLVDLGVFAGIGVAQAYDAYIRLVPLGGALIGPSIHVAGQIDIEIDPT